MNSLADFIDALLLNVAAYPVTLWNILFNASVVFNGHDTARVCPYMRRYILTPDHPLLEVA